ncbi:hypothetical protein BD410DRAFT_832210 [Rickenella mellea]|uniref:DUF6534 domain-containing protein n=1 Tax=Rickenella mellea TaxID=50990 RepID=A0A4Y7PMH7_9AGAM|nr:hypothetical protein BD410DRAFT_832210 [Rickenella mellea]
MPAPALDNEIGALFICLLVSTLSVFRLITVYVNAQALRGDPTYNYYQKFPEDRAHKKILVAFLVAFNAANVVLLSAGVYHYLITNFANFDALMEPSKSMNVSSFLNSLITWICQLFFAWRVWRLSSGNYFLTGVIICLTCTHFAFATSTFVLRVRGPTNDTTWSGEVVIGFKAQQYHLNELNSEVFIGITLGSALACDVVITASLFFFLNKSKTGFRRTDSLIKSLILYSLCTGLITSMFAIINITVFFSMRTNLIHLGIYFLMGKLYTTSLLAILNSRDIFRRRLRNDQTVNFSLSSSAFPQSCIIASRDRKGRDPIAIYTTKTSEVREDNFSANTIIRDSHILQTIGENSAIV